MCLLVLLCVPAICGCGHAASEEVDLAAADFPLVLTQDSAHVGQIWDHAPFQHDVWFRNRSQSVVRVEQIAAACECTLVENAAFEVAAGEMARVGVTVDPRGLLNSSELDAEFTTSIRPILSDGTSASFDLRLRVRRPYVLPADELAIQIPANDAETAPVAQASIQVHPQVAALSLSSTDERVQVVASSRSERQANYTIRLSPRSPVRLGPLKLPVEVCAQLRRGGVLDVAEDVLKCRVRSDLAWSPRAVLLTGVADLRRAGNSIKIRSKSGTPLRILRTHCPAGEIAIEPEFTDSRDAEGAIALRIRLVPQHRDASQLRLATEVQITVPSQAHQTPLLIAVPVIVDLSG